MNQLVSDPLDAIQTLSLEEVHLASKKEESKGKHIRSDSIVILTLVTSHHQKLWSSTDCTIVRTLIGERFTENII